MILRSGITARAGTFLNETLAWYAACAVHPTEEHLVAMDTLIQTLKTIGVWDKLDLMYSLAAHTAQAARINVKSPGTFDAVEIGTPTFQANRSYAGGSGSCLNTTWNPATNGVNFIQDDASLWLWSLTDTQSNSSDMGNSNARITTRNTTNQIGGGRINDGTNSIATVTNSAAFFGIQRRSSTDKRFWRNATQFGTFSVSSSAITSANVYIGGSSSSGGSTKEFAFAAWGASLAGLETDFYNAVQTYLTTVAASALAGSQSYSVFSGDRFEALYQDTSSVTYSLLSGDDTALFTLANGVLTLLGQDFASPADANSDNTYVANVRGTDPSTGLYTDFTVSVTVNALSPGTNQRYVLPTAQGLGDGTSWANAGTLSNIDAFITAVGPGGFVNIGTQSGAYTSTPVIGLTHGGSTSYPVTIRGVDASMTPSKPVLQGGRTVWSLPADPEQVTDVGGWGTGTSAFDFRFGANNLVFTDLRFEHSGAPFNFNSIHRNITIQNYEFLNVRRFVEMATGTQLTDITIKSGTGQGYSKSSIRIRGTSSNWLIQDVDHNSGRQTGDSFAVGVQMSENAHTITFLRAIMRNSHDQETSGSFWNGDGFSSESTNYDLTFDTCESYGNTDGGFDCKGVANTNFTFTNCISGDNDHNYKLWGAGTNASANFTLTGCQSNEPHNRGGNGGLAHFDIASYANVFIGGGTTITDTVAGGSVYKTENAPCTIRLAASVVEHSVKTRTDFYSGTTLTEGLPG